MQSRLPARLAGAFEFTDRFRRFALVRGGPAGLEAGYALSLLRDRLHRDDSLRGSLAAWCRRTIFTAGLEGDERLISTLLRDISAGWVRVHELDRPRISAYVHTHPRGEATAHELAPPALDPGLDEPTLADERAVEYLAVGDFNFSTDRAVMLPGPSSEAELEGDHADGVALIAGLLAHLRRTDGERKILVAGHTDAAGTFAHNLELSHQRAWSVKFVCDGDADGFADHAAVHGEVADGQEVLRWIARRFGWSCDPGPVDNDDGPKTSAARTRFRERFEAEFSEPAGSGPAFQRADWLAFARLYEQDLAARLGVTPGGLPPLRARLAWTDPPILGCGEHWPEASVRRSLVNHADRRVELLCFAPDHVPAGGGEPPGATVYDDPTYRWVAIRAGPGPHPLDGPCFEITIGAEDLEGLGERAAVRLKGGPYDLLHSIADARASAGARVFHFHGIVVGSRYDLFLDRDDGSAPDLLFEGASLDSYIHGIGAEDQRPSPIVVHLSRPPERREDDDDEDTHE